MRLVLLGPPGVGKGTQAKIISQRLGVVHISTGDILRREISSGTELGDQAHEFVKAGSLVPDSIVNKMVAQRLSAPDVAQGFLLDGYPRTVDQAGELDSYLTARGESLDVVIAFGCTEETVLARIEHRAKLEGRADDNTQTALHRLRVYNEQTAPLLDYYQTTSRLKTVDASGTVEQVFELAMGAIEA